MYIPGGLVEVIGVVDDFEYPLEDILQYGQGAFLYQSLPHVKVKVPRSEKNVRFENF